MLQSDTISPRLRQALAYAEKGIPVFPCRVGGKEPAIPGAFHAATTDTAKIRVWWSEADYNLGVCPEDMGACVIDPDGDEGKLWAVTNDLPPTYTVATPNGGLHLYFEGSLPSRANILASKVDTRGRGGYVLAPPSIVDGKPYRVVNAGPIAPLPAWIADRMPREHAKLAAPDDTELDQPWNIDLARAYLQSAHNRHGPWGENDDPDTFVIAAAVKDQGISADLTADLMMEYLPEDEREWLTKTVYNAFTYGQNEAGARAMPDPAVWRVEEYAPPPVEEPPPKFPPLLTAAKLSTMHFDPPSWVWENRLLEYEPNLYTGDAGVGKTTLAENIAVAVAAGMPLLGHGTQQMPVVLLAAEDTYGPVRDNLLAIRHALQAPEDCLAQIHVLSVKSDAIPGGHRLAKIDDDGTVHDTPFMQYLAGQIAALGRCLFVIDPIAEFVGFDRYKDDPCRALATTWLRAIARIGCTPLVTDHPSKASIASGDHYAGSVQLKAAFTLFATLKGGQWSGSLTRQRDMTFSVIKGRYAGEEDTRFLRSSKSPAFILQGGPQHQPDDHQVAVYRHVIERTNAGKMVSLTNSGEHGPHEIAFTLQIDERAVIMALSALCAREWLQKQKGAGYVTGPKARSLDDLDGGF